VSWKKLNLGKPLDLVVKNLVSMMLNDSIQADGLTILQNGDILQRQNVDAARGFTDIWIPPVRDGIANFALVDAKNNVVAKGTDILVACPGGNSLEGGDHDDNGGFGRGNGPNGGGRGGRGGTNNGGGIGRGRGGANNNDGMGNGRGDGSSIGNGMGHAMRNNSWF
jgi:hypothetical protein